MISKISCKFTLLSVEKIVVLTFNTLISIYIKLQTINIRCYICHLCTSCQSMIITLITTMLFRIYNIIITNTGSTFVIYIVPF